MVSKVNLEEKFRLDKSRGVAKELIGVIGFHPGRSRFCGESFKSRVRLQVAAKGPSPETPTAGQGDPRTASPASQFSG